MLCRNTVPYNYLYSVSTLLPLLGMYIVSFSSRTNYSKTSTGGGPAGGVGGLSTAIARRRRKIRFYQGPRGKKKKVQSPHPFIPAANATFDKVVRIATMGRKNFRVSLHQNTEACARLIQTIRVAAEVVMEAIEEDHPAVVLAAQEVTTETHHGARFLPMRSTTRSSNGSTTP